MNTNRRRGNALATTTISNDAPDWFRQALHHQVTTETVDVDGCDIHFLKWDTPADRSPETPNILFVHGRGAHANWWRFIAPFFTGDYRVAAMDLSGMGDSGYRNEYTPDMYVREIRAVLDHLEFHRNTIIVGHSFGGLMSMKFGAQYGDDYAGIIIVDSPVPDPQDGPMPDPAEARKIGRKLYPDRDTAISRFRFLPEQPVVNPYIFDFIAQTSIAEFDEGWSWKADLQVLEPGRFGKNHSDDLREMKGRKALIYGARSTLVTRQVATYMGGLMGPDAPVIEIPEAYHHLILDQPLAFVSTLRTLLATWRV